MREFLDTVPTGGQSMMTLALIVLVVVAFGLWAWSRAR